MKQTIPLTVPPEQSRAVETQDVCKRYGPVTALAGVDLAVPDGAVYALVGPNGAGKSTLMRSLLDLTRPDAGSVRVFGMDAASEGPQVRAQIGYVPEAQDWTPAWLTVSRLLEHHAAYYPSWDEGYAREMSDLFDVPLNRPLRKASKGQSRRTQLIMALAHRPRLLLMDEPTEGLDPVVRDEVHRLLTDHLADTATTVLLATHHVHEVAGLVDHVGVLSRGKLVAQVSLEGLDARLRRYRVEAPPGWSPGPEVEQGLVRYRVEGREALLVVWGEEFDIRPALERSGAQVRGASPLSLEEATLAMLTQPETDQ